MREPTFSRHERPARGGDALRVSVVGVGYWGPHYLRIVDELADAELASACDLDDDALQLVRERYPGVVATRDFSDVLADDAVDAVVLATPPATHATLAGAALRARKHVLCEKPLAMTAAECVLLAEEARAAERVLMVGHTSVFNPAVRTMRAEIADGAIGRVVYCHSTRTGPGPVRSGLNAFWDLAPHDLATILYLLDTDPLEIAAHGLRRRSEPFEDVVFGTLQLAENVLANVHVSWLDALKVRRVTAVGETGIIVFDDLDSDGKLKIVERGPDQDVLAPEARGKQYGEYRDFNREGRIVMPTVPPDEPLAVEVAHFVECCLDDLAPETDADAGRRIVEVLEAASRSLREDGRSTKIECRASMRT